jgi:hypothetical protein
MRFTWVVASHIGVLALGVAGFMWALPSGQGVVVNVGRPLRPVGQDLGVGITLAVVVAAAGIGARRLVQLHDWWAAVSLCVIALLVILAFLSMAAFIVSGVFI